MSKQGYVYIATDEDTPGHCKIGKADDVATRQRTLNSGKPKPTIKIVASVLVDDNVAVEAAFKQILHHQHAHGEWFNIEEHRVRPMLMCFERAPLEGASSDRGAPADAVVRRGSWHEDGWKMHCAGATQAEIAERFGVSQGAVVALKRKMRGAGRSSEETHRSERRPSTGTAPSRSRPSATPISAYRQPIVDVLKDLGGGGQAKAVLEQVEQRMKAKLNQADYRRLKNGQEVWSNKAQWMRQQLKNEGVLKSDSRRGWWELA